jgi:fructokinase
VNIEDPLHEVPMSKILFRGQSRERVDIVCLGELLIDMMPAELGRSLVEVSAFYPKPGGAPANVAVAAARLGARAAFIGKVGDEAFGHYLAEVLQREGVDVSGMRFDPEARTPLAFIALPDPNTQEILFYRNPGADTRLRPDELDRELLHSTRALHFGSLSLIQEPSRSATMEAVRLARAGGALISFDVNYRPNLWGPSEARKRVMETIPHVDLLKINERELALLADAAGVPQLATWDPRAGIIEAEIAQVARWLLAQGPRLCVVTLGPQGSFFQTAKQGVYVPAFAVDPVDTTGCGDGFIAGLLCRLTASGDWREQLTAERTQDNLRYASAVGALTALKPGVIPSLPTATQVDEFLAQRAT